MWFVTKTIFASYTLITRVYPPNSHILVIGNNKEMEDKTMKSSQ